MDFHDYFIVFPWGALSRRRKILLKTWHLGPNITEKWQGNMRIRAVLVRRSLMTVVKRTRFQSRRFGGESPAQLASRRHRQHEVRCSFGRVITNATTRRATTGTSLLRKFSEWYTPSCLCSIDASILVGRSVLRAKRTWVHPVLTVDVKANIL